MPHPFRTNPMIQFLAQRALRASAQAPGDDPWHGVGAVALRITEEGPIRTPSTWMRRWTSRMEENFWRSQSHGLLQVKEPAGGMGELLKAQNTGRKRPVVWGEWPSPAPEVMMGITLPKASVSDRLPAPVEVVGVEFSPGEKDDCFRKVLEELRDEGREAWWIVPAKGKSWKNLEREHYLLAHRLGVSLWLETPPQAGWADYQETLAEVTRQMCRDMHWEQWLWPVCDLLQKGLEESLNPLAPKASAPWQWEGRIRRPNWPSAQRVVWEAAEELLGGAGVLDELLVASALADKGALSKSG